MRVVLDTNILVRANPKTKPNGLAKDLLLKIITSPHMLVLSPAILAEAGRVLHYPHVQKRWPLSDEAIHTYLGLRRGRFHGGVAYGNSLHRERP